MGKDGRRHTHTCPVIVACGPSAAAAQLPHVLSAAAALEPYAHVQPRPQAVAVPAPELQPWHVRQRYALYAHRRPSESSKTKFLLKPAYFVSSLSSVVEKKQRQCRSATINNNCEKARMKQNQARTFQQKSECAAQCIQIGRIRSLHSVACCILSSCFAMHRPITNQN